MITRIPVESGPEIARHHPVTPWKAWIWLIGLSYAFPIYALIDAGWRDPSVLILFILSTIFFFIGCGYAVSEWFFLDYRIHERALIVGCVFPGMRTVVIPFYSIDPDSFHLRDREKVPVGQAKMAPDYRRGSPACSHELRFNAIKTTNARRLAHWRHRKPFYSYLDNPYTNRWELVTHGDGIDFTTALHQAVVTYRTHHQTAPIPNPHNPPGHQP